MACRWTPRQIRLCVVRMYVPLPHHFLLAVFWYLSPLLAPTPNATISREYSYSMKHSQTSARSYIPCSDAPAGPATAVASGSRRVRTHAPLSLCLPCIATPSFSCRPKPRIARGRHHAPALCDKHTSVQVQQRASFDSCTLLLPCSPPLVASFSCLPPDAHRCDTHGGADRPRGSTHDSTSRNARPPLICSHHIGNCLCPGVVPRLPPQLAPAAQRSPHRPTTPRPTRPRPYSTAVL